MTATAPRKPGTWPPGRSGNPTGLAKHAPPAPVDIALRRLVRRGALLFADALVAAAKGDSAQATAMLEAMGEARVRARA